MSRQQKRPWGAGSIHLRGDGRWTGQLFVTESTTGRRRRRTLYGKSREDVEEKLRTLVDLERRGEPIAPNSLTLAAYLEEWLNTVVSVRVRPNTLAGYRYHVDRYLKSGIGRRPLGSLTAREVRVYLDKLRGEGVGTRTVQYVHSTLRAALEDAVREEIIGKNVAKLVRVPRPPKQDRAPLTLDEVKALLQATREHRLHAMFVVFAVLGLRRSEVLGLMWADVDLDAGTLLVRHGLQRVDGKLLLLPTKTLRSRRTVALPELVVEALRAHRRRQRHEREHLGPRWGDLGYVFTTPVGTPIDPRNCSRVVQEACKTAGVRVVRLHDFRHGCVSVLLGMGVPPRTVMDIVGHTTLELTMNVYGHVSLDEKRAAMHRLGGLLDNDEGAK